MTIALSQPENTETAASLAENLSAARIAAGYTVDQLAVTCGLTADEIHAVEKGEDEDPARIRRIAAALQLPVEDGV